METGELSGEGRGGIGGIEVGSGGERVGLGTSGAVAGVGRTTGGGVGGVTMGLSGAKGIGTVMAQMRAGEGVTGAGVGRGTGRGIGAGIKCC